MTQPVQVEIDEKHHCYARHFRHGEKDDSCESFDTLEEAEAWCSRQRQYAGFYRAWIKHNGVERKWGES